MKKIFALLLLFAVLYSCERDDICPESTPTTPHLVIRFYDIDEQSETLNVVGLQIQGVDNDEIYQSATSTDSIAIPLKTDDVVTKFKLHKEYNYDDNGTLEDTSDDIISGNEDIITIAYSIDSVYVSRACGYKAIFNNVQISVEDDGDKWIELLQSENPLTVDDETAAHVQIFH